MSRSGGEIRAERAKPPRGVEDRLSALPDDVLVLILQCLDTTAEAARTSVLARRWRSLWALLPELRFHLRPDGDRIRELLEASPSPDAAAPPELRGVSVTTQGAVAGSATALLSAAARRLAGGLVYRNVSRDPYKFDDEEKARRDASVELPCFEKATAIELDLTYAGVALPSLGVFTRLTNLSLRCVEFCGPCDLGDVVSSARCPCLQKLSVCNVWVADDLSIHSESLLQMELRRCSLSQLTIVTPILQKLSVQDNFVDSDPGELVANMTAHQIVSLVWKDHYHPRYFHLGNLGKLRELQTWYFLVYGDQFVSEYNHPCLRLLQRFQVLYSLHLSLIYAQDICDYQYLLGDITVLPQIMFLQLDLYNNGHVFGASLFHVLKMCIGLRRLLLVISKYDDLEGVWRRLIYTKEAWDWEETPACPSECICDQSKNWKTDELVLDHLEDVHIIGLQGAEHEVAFVQRLFSWATVLKRLRITLDKKMNEGEIGEFREALAGFSRPETCVQFDTNTSDK